MTVAANIINKCGGVEQTALLAGVTINWVYRWKMPVEKGGLGGRVPRKAQDSLIAAGRVGLVDIKPSDFYAVSK